MGIPHFRYLVTSRFRNPAFPLFSKIALWKSLHFRSFVDSRYGNTAFPLFGRILL